MYVVITLVINSVLGGKVDTTDEICEGVTEFELGAAVVGAGVTRGLVDVAGDDAGGLGGGAGGGAGGSELLA